MLKRRSCLCPASGSLCHRGLSRAFYAGLEFLKVFQRERMISKDLCDSCGLLQPFPLPSDSSCPAPYMSFHGLWGKFAILWGSSRLCTSLPAPAACSSMPRSHQLPVIFLQAIFFFFGGVFILAVSVTEALQRRIAGAWHEDSSCSGIRLGMA